MELQDVLALADRGWAVFPVTTRGDRKAPAISKKSGGRGCYDGTADRAQIVKWWGGQYRGANVGIATGAKSGFWALDIDGPEGRASLAQLEIAHGVLPTTLAVRTGRVDGGQQRYFKAPIGVKIPLKVGEDWKHRGLDVRGDGGYVIAAGSLHASGAYYAFEDPTASIAEAPGWLLDLIVEREPAPPPVTAPSEKKSSRLSEGELSPLQRAALKSAIERVQNAREGSRNKTFNVEVYGLAECRVPRAIAEPKLKEAARASSANGEEPVTEAEIEATFASAWIAGSKAPPRVERSRRERSPPAPPRGARPPAEPSHDAGVAMGGPPEGPGWRHLLHHRGDEKEENGIKASIGNLLRIIENDERLNGILAYNEHAYRAIALQRPPWSPAVRGVDYPRWLEDEDTVRALQWFEDEYGTEWHDKKGHAALLSACKRKRFHPVREYLDGLTWDGVERCPYWLSDHFDVDDTELNHAIATRWLISGVARIYEPGCVAQSLMILEGPQGYGKSRALACLAGVDKKSGFRLFKDETVTVGTKESAMALRGVWIFEFSEIAALKKSETEVTKGFLSRTHDQYRGVWERHDCNQPRQMIFAGTTNEYVYMRDLTGGRRFWPVRVKKRCDIEALARVRDQLWAEAVVRYHRKESWHLDTPELEAMAGEAIAARTPTDPWEDVISGWIENRAHPTTTEALQMLQERNFNVGRADIAESMRVAAIFSRCGYTEKKKLRNGAGRQWVYFRPEDGQR